MSPGEILFIFGGDPKSKNQVRRHIAQVVKDRRKLRLASKISIHQYVAEADDELKLVKRAGNHKGNILPDSEESEHEELRDPSFNKKKPKNSVLTVEDRYRSHEVSLQGTDLRGKRRQLQPQSLPSVKSYLGSSSTDPFDTLPIKLDSVAAACLDHFLKGLPYLEYGVDGDSQLIPARHIAFRGCMSWPAALHGEVATGATHLASLTGESMSSLIYFHVAESLRLTQEALSRLSEDTLAEVCHVIVEMAAGADYRGEIGGSQAHLNGVRNLLMQFGGLLALDKNPNTQILVCYVLNGSAATYFPLIDLNPKQCRGVDNFCRSKGKSLNSLETSLDLAQHQVHAVKDIYAQVGNFCAFMNNVAVDFPRRSDPVSRQLRKLIPDYFHPGNQLLELLQNSSTDSDRPAGLGPNGLHRLSCLFLIVMQLLRLSENGDLASIRLYLDWLQQVQHSKIRLLHDLLIINNNHIKMRHPTWTWDVVRFMQVYKLLGDDTKRRVSDSLVAFLVSKHRHSSSTDDNTELEEEVKLEYKFGMVFREALFNAVTCTEQGPTT